MYRIKSFIKNIIFIIINLINMNKLRNIPETIIDDNLIITGATVRDLKEVYAIYSFFHNNSILGIEKRIIYFFLSQKCVLIVKEISSKKIIGISLYYKNKRDLIDNTIHGGYRCILPEYQHSKVGAIMTQHITKHLKNNNVNGISSRISLNNKPSLMASLSRGSKPIERYFDKDMNEERYYLVRSFNNSHSWNFLKIDENGEYR